MHPVIRTLVTALIAGCGSGVFVEVSSNGVPVETIELVTASSTCRVPFQEEDKCDSIQGPTSEGFKGPAGKPGDLYTRDGSATAVLEGGTVAFDVSGGNDIAMAFAIGRDANGKAIGVAVMDHTIDVHAGTLVYHVALDAADPMFSTARSPDHAEVTEWGNHECIGVAPINPDTHSPFFILPKDNPDCDEFVNDRNECNQLWFDGFSTDPGAQHCVVQSTQIDPLPNNTGPCVVGHVPRCSDIANDPTMPACIETQSCLPAKMCTTASGCGAFDQSCLEPAFESASMNPRIGCVMSATPGAGTGVSCDGESAEVALRPKVVGTCVDAKFIQTKQVFDAPRDADLAIATATFHVEAVTSACHIKFSWSGSGNIGSTTDTALVVTVAGSNGNRELWFPMTFTIGSQCVGAATPIPCTTDPNGGPTDSMFACGI